MTNITFESDGFTLEQKFSGKEFKTFIHFDNVTNKIGYYKNTNYYYIALAVIFGVLLFIEILKNGFRILSLFYGTILLYYLYEFIVCFQKYKTLSLNNSKDIYFKKDECKYIDEILNNRNKYYYETYFNNI
jgi:predicted membrane protein